MIIEIKITCDITCDHAGRCNMLRETMKVKDKASLACRGRQPVQPPVMLRPKYERYSGMHKPSIISL
jgi:hypothetical protein